MSKKSSEKSESSKNSVFIGADKKKEKKSKQTGDETTPNDGSVFLGLSPKNPNDQDPVPDQQDPVPDQQNPEANAPALAESVFLEKEKSAPQGAPANSVFLAPNTTAGGSVVTADFRSQKTSSNISVEEQPQEQAGGPVKAPKRKPKHLPKHKPKGAKKSDVGSGKWSKKMKLGPDFNSSLSFNGLLEKINKIQNEILDTSIVGSSDIFHKSISDIYFFVAACLSGYWIGHVVGTYLLQNVIPELGAFVAIVLVMPLLALTLFHPEEHDDQETERIKLFILTTLCAISMGTWSTDRLVNFNSPPVILFPLLVACGAWRAGSNFGEMPRIQMQVVTLLPCLVAYLLIGMVSDILSVQYFVWLLAFTLAVAIDLQGPRNSDALHSDPFFLPTNNSDDWYIQKSIHQESSSQYVAFLVLSIVMFAFGCVTNSAVILRLLRQGVLRARIRMLLFSLTSADLLYIILEFPLNQFVWLATVYWTTGEVTCRLSAFARGFSAYLIAFILVVISLDRCLNTVRPVAPKEACRRMKKLLVAAAIGAIICALPQLGIFYLADVPGAGNNSKQCVSRGLVDQDDIFSSVVYPLFTFICLYIVPLALISMSYTVILYSMTTPCLNGTDVQKIIIYRQSANGCSLTNGHHSGSTSSSTATLNGSSRAPLTQGSLCNDAYIRKAQMKTLRILLMTVVAFFVCWLPYYVTMLFYVCNRELATRVLPFWVFKLAELSAVSNACINPFIYGNYLLKIKQRFKCWRKR